VRRFAVIAGVLGMVLAMATSALAAPDSLVRNGSFERPEVTSGSFQEFTAGDTIQTANEWHVGTGSVDVVEEPEFDAARGDQALDLNGAERGSVYQTLATDANQDYILGFYLAGNPECNDGVKVLKVFWGGELVATYRYDPTGQSASDLNWQLRALELTATSTSTRLRFASANDGACGPMIDAVRVTPVAA
jgi:choice-of-anchor C domain-containing protein